MGIDRIKRDTDRYGFAMTETIPGHLLKFVRGPMTIVERPSFLHLKRVTTMGNVVQMHQDTGANGRHHGRPISTGNILGMLT